MTCKATQHSDQMVCKRCDAAWDMNDREPPPCSPTTTLHTWLSGRIRHRVVRQWFRHVVVLQVEVCTVTQQFSDQRPLILPSITWRDAKPDDLDKLRITSTR